MATSQEWSQLSRGASPRYRSYARAESNIRKVPPRLHYLHLPNWAVNGRKDLPVVVGSPVLRLAMREKAWAGSMVTHVPWPDLLHMREQEPHALNLASPGDPYRQAPAGGGPAPELCT